MLRVLADVIAPVLVVTALGAFVGRRFGIDVRPFSTMGFNLFSPSLVFVSMADIDLPADVALSIVGVGAAALVIALLLAGVQARVSDLDSGERAGVGLVAGFPNSGNMGLPISFLAFGDEGLEIAVVVFVTSAVLVFTCGVMVASSASGRAWGHVARAPLTVPSVWAAFGGLAVNWAGVDLPPIVEASVGTMAQAAVPVMLVVLGLQLERSWSLSASPATLGASAQRLILGPAVSWALCSVVGLDGVVRDTVTVMGAMPTAVVTTILATEYEADAAEVTKGVVITTLASVVSLTILVAALT